MGSENKPLTSIRGFAALWVVSAHLVPSGKGVFSVYAYEGYTAVDLFFILSGLILSQVYADLSREAVPMFWLRRACRLYPLHIAATLLLFVILIASGNWAYEGNAWGIAASFLLIHPFVDIPTMANPPSWSIGVELVCYLAFPVLIAGLRRVGRGPAFLLLLLALAAELAVQIAYPVTVHGRDAMLRGFAGFALGMVVWRLTLGRDPSARFIAILETLSVAGILGSVILMLPTLVPLFSALLLFCLAFDRGPVASFLRKPVCVWLGRISFSIYLLHFLVISAAEVWFPMRNLPLHGGIGRTLREIAIVAVLLGLSELSYRLIEAPGRRLPAWLARRKIAAGSVALPGAELAGTRSPA